MARVAYVELLPERNIMTKKTGAELLVSGKRFAVAMWDYSWLVQRYGKENEYEDWDRVLDELVERGYNCIRIDAHPHLIARGPDGKIQENFTMFPIDQYFMWGNHQSVTVNPRKGLLEFMHKARERDLYIGLSGWYNDDTTHRKFMVKSPEDYIRIWTETLDLLSAEDLLDIIVWIDVCNEFPGSAWAPGPFQDIFNRKQITDDIMKSIFPMMFRWKKSTIRRFARYLKETIAGLKDKYPDLKYTFSFQGMGSNNIMRADVSTIDLAEPHIWSTDDFWWCLKSGMLKWILKWSRSQMLKSQTGGYPEGLEAYVKRVMRLYPKSRERCRKILDRRTNYWLAWAKKNNLPLVTTEGWTAVFYEDISPNGEAGEWEWFKDVAEIGVRMAIEKGWQGVCTSNFCEPHFEGMWVDVEWHQRMTDLILNG